MTVELVVQGDDFGMCHAVNMGVVRAFTEGIVTQASVMAACPWFDEAAYLAALHGIPTGLHQTLTCEWDYLRWGPITGSPALVDGTFPRTVVDAQALVGTVNPTAELLAQAARARTAGLSLRYLDVHMGMVAPDAYSAVSSQLSVPFLYPGLETSLEFASIAMLSQRPDKRAWLLSRLERLEPGRHLLVTHPAVPGVEIAAITKSDSEPAPWAEEYRASDLEVLTDPSVRERIADLGIELVAL